MSGNLNNLTQARYSEMTDRRSGRSRLAKDCTMAFLSGGLICVIAESFRDLITADFFRERVYAFDSEGASAITTLFMVFLGALLTALNVYDVIGRVAGAGSIVPITGFANSVVSPAMEYRSEGRILGVGAQMFVVAGPVLVYGTAASVLAGLLYFLLR